MPMFINRHQVVTIVWQIKCPQPVLMKRSGHLRLEQIRLLPGQEWTDEGDVWRFCAIADGVAYWLGSSPCRDLNQGDMIVLGPRLKALVRASQLNKVVLQEFTFAPASLGAFFTFAERDLFEKRDLPAVSAPEFFDRSHPLAESFARLIHRKTGEADMTERANLLGLVASFFDLGCSLPRLSQSLLTSAQNRFEQLMSQISEQEIAEQTAAELGRLCGCSPRHFNRLFRRRFGQSLRARQTEMRLVQAGQMLTGTKRKVMEIAQLTGYRSLSVFNVMFKNRYGINPSTFRKEHGSARTGPEEPNGKPAGGKMSGTTEQPTES
jgi:AraC-like DNA-binding protein